MDIHEGFVPVPGGQVWYKIVGSSPAIPLLTLHGGPSTGHDYIYPLAVLTSKRPVVFYDQLGCGKSDQPADRSLWRIERFVDEVTAIRQALGLERIHLFGHSWGGWLAIEYMLTQPAGVYGLILAGTSASVPEYEREVAGWVRDLPSEARTALQHYAAIGDLGHADYQAAYEVFAQRHIYRQSPVPESLMRAGQNMRGNPVFEYMWGPNDLVVTGTLKMWDRSNRLGEINVPTLITCGQYDEVSPRCAQTLQQGIPGAELYIFEQSAHMPHLEETDNYLHVLRDFMHRVEAQ